MQALQTAASVLRTGCAFGKTAFAVLPQRGIRLKVLLMQAFQTAASVHPLCVRTGCAFGKTAFAVLPQRGILMSEVKEGRIEVLISEEKVQERIRELGEQISKDYAGKSIQMICILKGASVFMVDLAKRITVPVYMDFMSVSSYGSGTESSGIVKINKDLDDPIVGKDVLIIEDIIDTGRTLNYLKKFLKNRGASSIKIATLLDKPARRVISLTPEYVGFTVPDEFVIGCGMDYDQRYRNLPYIGVVRQ
jgi:hypoxanthine phosphoribosyltransferase